MFKIHTNNGITTETHLPNYIVTIQEKECLPINILVHKKNKAWNLFKFYLEKYDKQPDSTTIFLKSTFDMYDQIVLERDMYIFSITLGYDIYFKDKTEFLDNTVNNITKESLEIDIIWWPYLQKDYI